MHRRVFATARKRFSTVPSAPKSDASSESSQVPFWKKNPYYAIIGIPTLLSSIVAIDIINNVNHRNTLELYCPAFVGFVREQYGFSDEDPAERARVKFVSEELNKPVNVSVRMRSGDLLSLSDVDGAQPAGQLSQELVAKAGDAGDSYTSSNKVLLSARFATSSTSTPQNTATTQSTPHKASVDYRLQSEDATPLFDSLWAGAPGTSSGTAVELQAPLTKEVLYLRFGNVYSDIMTGLHRYSEQGTQRVPLGPLHDDSPERRYKVQAQKKTAASAQPDLVKIQAQERIKSLQLEIASLEQERRMGRREIDAVDSDIRARRQEITNISRKYLNYFYYF